jgi:HEAT repeat protein
MGKFIMALTTFSKPSSLVDQLIDELESNDLNRRREAIQLLRSARPISTLCRALRSSQSDLRSILICDILAAIRHRAAVSDLIAILNAPNDEVRAAAANALGNIGDPRSVPALIQLLQDQAEPVCIRDTAAYALGMTRSPDAVPVLIEALGDPTSSVRRCAAEALGRCGDERALPTLQDILRRENEDDSVKADVTSAIETIRRRTDVALE